MHQTQDMRNSVIIAGFVFFGIMILVNIAGDVDHPNIVAFGAFVIACIVGNEIDRSQK